MDQPKKDKSKNRDYPLSTSPVPVSMSEIVKAEKAMNEAKEKFNKKQNDSISLKNMKPSDFFIK